MLSVTDDRTGTPVEVRGARRGLLTVTVRLSSAQAAAPGDLRALVVADVLRRVVESFGPQVVMETGRPGPDGARAAELDRAASALGVPRGTVGTADAGAADVQVVADGATVPPGAADGIRVAVGPVSGWPRDAELPVDRAADPCALRLAMLRYGHREDADLGPDRLADAGRTLARWRQGVAAWSCEPSRPLPGEIRAAGRAALAGDLDTAAVLDLLDQVAEAPGIAAGAKFEVFSHLDRFLALELPRDIGSW